MTDSTNSAVEEPEVVEAEPVATRRKWWQAKEARWLFIAIGVLTSVCVIGLVSYSIGYQFGSSAESDAASEGDGTRWTCSMHPSVDLPKPGKCPICFMALIPKDKSKSGGHPRELVMSKEAAALADIQTTQVTRRFVTNDIRMVGKVDYDETKLAYITAWVGGRLDRLFIDYTGVRVRKGDHLVSMYSPDLVVAQRELLQVWNNYQKLGQQRRDDYLLRTLKSTEEKLRLLGLTKQQIEDVKQSGKVNDHVTIYADIDGVVIHKNASEGMYVETGTKIYTIADLSQVWVFMDAYESDLPWIRYGQEVEFTTETYPGEIFKGRVAFIDPTLNEKTRTSRIRVNVANSNGRLKPGMFVRAMVKSRIAEGGQVIDSAMAGKWVSPHHPEIVRDGPGKCPICEIDLVPAEELGFVEVNENVEPPLVIPVTAPLITGRRAVVYVKVPKAKQPTFRGREVMLGQRAGDYYIVRHGLSEGEQVVTSGNFKIDSALQILAKPSMMNPAGGVASTGHHHHGDGGHEGHGVGSSTPGIRKKELEVPAAFRLELSPTWNAYLKASDALAGDDLAAARSALKGLLESVKKVKYDEWLDGDGRSRWKTIIDAVIFATHDALDAGDRDETRLKFEQVSLSITPLIQTFGHAMENPIYQFRCDMAFNNKGASWLQVSSKARNPYYGSKMLECGDVTATLYPQGPLDVPETFRQQLSTVYDSYLELQTALAADDQDRARLAIAKLHEEVSKVDATKLIDRAKSAWMVARSELETSLSAGQVDGLPMKQLRERFEPISETMLGVIDSFGHASDRSLYKAFCPMAFEDKGAPWLQAGETIANPYFGSKMLKCGSIKREFPSKLDANPEAQP